MKRVHLLQDIIIALGIWWAIAIALATVQWYASYKIAYYIPLGIVAMMVVFALHLAIAHYYKKKAWIKYIIIGYALTFFIPLKLQFLRMRPAGIDTVVVALIGLVIFYLAND